MERRNIAMGAIIASAILFAAVLVYADDGITVRVNTDRRIISIGGRILYTIEVAAPRGSAIEMPVFKDNVIGEFEIKDLSSKVKRSLGGGKVFYNRYHITAYSIGKKDIPALNIKYKTQASKKWDEKKTAAITIEVRSVLPKNMPRDIKDIKGPISLFEINWFAAGITLAVFIALAALLLIIIRSRLRKPVRLPHETASEELEAIRRQLITSGQVKEYFVGVSDCVRRYIERAFKLKAPEMTTEEFLYSLRASQDLIGAHKELLKSFMNACDLVKFAKYLPAGEEMENIYITAKQFIIETKPSENHYDSSLRGGLGPTKRSQ